MVRSGGLLRSSSDLFIQHFKINVWKISKRIVLRFVDCWDSGGAARCSDLCTTFGFTSLFDFFINTLQINHGEFSKWIVVIFIFILTVQWLCLWWTDAALVLAGVYLLMLLEVIMR